MKDLPGGLQTECIYRENLYLIAAPGIVKEGDLADPAQNIVNDAFLKKQPFISIKKGHAIRKKTDSIFRKKKITPIVSMEVSSCISAVQLAHSGLGITIVPSRAPEALGGTDRFCCYQYGENPDAWDVNVVYKKDSYLDRTERSFIELLKSVFP